MLSNISDYKPINEQDIGIKIESENHNWSSFSDKNQTYIRAQLVSVETQIAYSEALDPAEGHFQREQINYSYLLTFQEGSELKTYKYYEKPTDLGQYYLYTIKNNHMISCYHSEKGFKDNIIKQSIAANADADLMLTVLLGLSGSCFTAGIVFSGLPFSFMITLAALFLSSLGLKYLINKKQSTLVNRIIEKLKDKQ